MTTVGARFGAVVAAEPTRPLLTWYDDGSEERAELSGATLANWVAKTANLLVDGLGLGLGDRAVVLLPPHWQTAAILLGAWSAGLTVAGQPRPDEIRPGEIRPGEIRPGEADPGRISPGEIGFTTPDRAGELTQPERYLVGLHPLGLPLRDVPAGYQDYAVEVRGYADRFDTPAGGNELIAVAQDRAAVLRLSTGDRVLIDVDNYPDPLDWLLAPLAAGVSTVLCGHLDPSRVARRIEVERVTRTLTG